MHSRPLTYAAVAILTIGWSFICWLNFQDNAALSLLVATFWLGITTGTIFTIVGDWRRSGEK